MIQLDVLSKNIKKMMEEIFNKEIGVLAQQDYRYIKIFQQFDLDFFCKGTLTLNEVILNSQVDKNEVVNLVNQIQNSEATGLEVDIDSWPLDLLANYIQKTHHIFTDKILVDLKTAIGLFLENDLPEKEIISAFKTPLESMAGELGAHMKREELVLFPTIKKIVMTRGKLDDPGERTVQNPVDKMIHEHDTQFVLLQEIRRILANYKLTKEASKEYVEIVSMMKSLDKDLGIHLHLENNILFPKAVKLEHSKVMVD